MKTSQEPPRSFLNQKLSEKDIIWRETNLKSHIVKSIKALAINLSDYGRVKFIYNDTDTTIIKECNHLEAYGMKMKINNTDWFIFPQSVIDFIPKDMVKYAKELGHIVIIKYMTSRLQHLLLEGNLVYKYQWGDSLGYFVPKNNYFLFKEAIANSNIKRF